MIEGSPSSVQFIAFLLLLAIPILPNLWSIWHAFYREFPTPAERLIWIAACVFAPVLGGVAYILVGRRRARKFSKATTENVTTQTMTDAHSDKETP